MKKCKEKIRRSGLILFTILAISSCSALNLLPGYDSNQRPNSGAVADSVKVSTDLISIQQINENDQEFTVELIVRKTWTDPRLSGIVKDETLYSGQVFQAWAPDLYISNSVSSKHLNELNLSFTLKPTGEITLSERVISQISCPMGFAKFPFGDQVCTINFKSYAYTDIHIHMVWHGKTSQDVPVFHNEYSFVSAEQSSHTENTQSGRFSKLSMTITLRRSGIRYLCRVIVPSAIMVLISYLTIFLQLNKKKVENTSGGKSIRESEAQEGPPSGQGPESELNSVQVGLVRLVVNGLMILTFVFVAQINLLNSPSAATVTGLDVWLGIVGLLVFLLFIQSLAVIILEPNKKKNFGDNIQDTLVQNVDKKLLLGIPIFFVAFTVIYFAVYWS